MVAGQQIERHRGNLFQQFVEYPSVCGGRNIVAMPAVRSTDLVSCYRCDETRDGVHRPVKSRPTRSNLMAGAIKTIRRYPPTRSVAGSLSIGHRAPSGFDCLRAARKFARNLLSPIPFGSLSSCQICRYSPEKQPVDIFRVFACASHTPAQSIGGSASGRGGRI